MIPSLHLVTNDVVIADPAFTDRARDAIVAGGTRIAFHLRGPRSSGRRVYEVGAGLRPAARSAGAPFLVNDRLDVALALDSDGVHLGARSVSVPVARRLLGPTAWIGRSVHGVREAEASAGSDFLLAGPVYTTSSHPTALPAGFRVIDEARAACPDLPVLGIGGITPERVPELIRSGAAGVAVVGAWWDTADPAGAVVDLLTALDEALETSGTGTARV